MALTLVGPAWTRTFRCLWMLEELGVPYEHWEDYRPASRRVRALHGTGKVPLLLHHHKDNATPFQLSESVAINTYLGDLYPDSGLVPSLSNTRDRALYNEVTCCLLSEVDAQGLWIHSKHEVMGQYFGFLPDAVQAAKTDFARVHTVFAQEHPTKLYVLGEQFTAADILYVTLLDWAQSIGWVDRDCQKDYRDRCHARPAFQRAHAIRKESIRQRNKAEAERRSKL